VWHVAISTIPMPKPTKGKIVNGKRQPPAPVPQIIVDVLLPTPAPQPILNKPVILSPEGTVEAEKVEKSMIQKCVKSGSGSQNNITDDSADTGRSSVSLFLYRFSQQVVARRRSREQDFLVDADGNIVYQIMTTLGRCSSLPVS
jgi:hypothetical protein